MSKSIGNVLLVHDLIADIPGEVIRLVLLSAHYRQPVDWTDDTVAQARQSLDGMYTALRKIKDVDAEDVGPPAAFVAALEDDLNTPQALAELHALVRQINVADDADLPRLKGALLAAGSLMGLLQQDADAWFTSGVDDATAIEALILERNAARKAKNFARADEIRDQFKADGIEIEDGPSGTTWKRL